MTRLSITGKIWLSIGIFVLGFIVATILGQVQGVNTESDLRTTSEALFPAAQRSQESESSFQRMVKGFSDSVMVQDASGLDRAAEEGRRVVEGLNAVSAIKGITPERSASARKLASSIEQFLSEARGTYTTLLANPANTTSETQAQMRELASLTETIKGSLQAMTNQFSKDLHERLGELEKRSAQQRWLALLVFGISLVIASILVNVTIRRSIAGPILRVIHGVQEAADRAAAASDQMARSGEVVARDAQEQASCLQETTASLEEISTTTRENANRASEADTLMGKARQTVDRAKEVMKNLTVSMDATSTSSRQVAAVLKSIDEIAFQTNILALNAAVEAARAGQAGAGFSVVADEVRSLAKRAADAARRSAEIVEKTIADVGEGVKLVSLAHGSFQEVSETITTGSQVVSQIAASSEKQSRGVTHINQTISRMEQVTQNNSSNARQTAESASAMSGEIKTTRQHIDELVAVVGLRRA